MTHKPFYSGNNSKMESIKNKNNKEELMIKFQLSKVKEEPKSNLSNFDIGKEGLINRKQWISTYKDSFRPSSVKRISNPGILSDMAKRTHYKLNNIEYGLNYM